MFNAKSFVIAAVIAAAAIASCDKSKADVLTQKQREAFVNSVGVIAQTAFILGQETKSSELGGATLIAPNVIVTAAHVIPRNLSAYFVGEVSFGNKQCEVKVIQVLAYDTLADMAVLMLEKKPPCMAVASISKDLVPDQKVCTKRDIVTPFPNTNGAIDKNIAFGNFEIQYSDLSCAKINKIYQVNGSRYFVFNVPDYIEPGFSGFPSLNKRGEVVGVNSSGSHKYSIITHIRNMSALQYFKF